VSNPIDQFAKRFSLLIRGRNVEENKFICTFFSIECAKFNWVTGIADVFEIYSLYRAAFSDILFS
jgi:hypothetical protein